MGFLKWLFGEDDNNASAMAFVNDANGISKEQAATLQKELLERLETNSEPSDEINIAAQLMTGGAYEEACEAWQKIGEKYPRKRAMSASQIGAALYFLGEYEKAIEHYIRARDLGMDATMMQMNIEEAEEALAKKG